MGLMFNPSNFGPRYCAGFDALIRPWSNLPGKETNMLTNRRGLNTFMANAGKQNVHIRLSIFRERIILYLILNHAFDKTQNNNFVDKTLI